MKNGLTLSSTVGRALVKNYVKRFVDNTGRTYNVVARRMSTKIARVQCHSNLNLGCAQEPRSRATATFTVS